MQMLSSKVPGDCKVRVCCVLVEHLTISWNYWQGVGLDLKEHPGLGRRPGPIPEDNTGTGDWACRQELSQPYGLRMVNDQKPQGVP